MKSPLLPNSLMTTSIKMCKKEEGEEEGEEGGEEEGEEEGASRTKAL